MPLKISDLATPTLDPLVELLIMTKKTFPTPKKETRTWFMFPLLHKDVATAVSDDIPSVWFHKKNTDRDSNNEYATNVMGKFICNNNACSTGGWASKKVAILIRGYPKNGYNAEVYNQRCKSCNQLGFLKLDEKSYVDRVTYRLKKWAGVAVDKPFYAQKDSLLYIQSLCEGCKRGVCGRTNN